MHYSSPGSNDPGSGRDSANIPRYQKEMKQSPRTVPSLDFEHTKSPAALLALAAGTKNNHLFQAFHCIDGGRSGQMLSMQGHL